MYDILLFWVILILILIILIATAPKYNTKRVRKPKAKKQQPSQRTLRAREKKALLEYKRELKKSMHDYQTNLSILMEKKQK